MEEFKSAAAIVLCNVILQRPQSMNIHQSTCPNSESTAHAPAAFYTLHMLWNLMRNQIIKSGLVVSVFWSKLKIVRLQNLKQF